MIDLSSYLYGALGLGFWGYVIAAVVMTQATIWCVTLFLHRDQTHRGVDLHPAVRHVCRLWLWLTTGINTKEWVAIHRKHHARCETEDDPHSPQVYGLRKVLFEGAELYRDESRNRETVEKYGRGTVDDWFERRIYGRLTFTGVTLMAVIDLVLFGLPGITIFGVQMATIPFCAAGVINGVGHYFGYRNFECEDASRNIVPWALFLGGEELHNNHHAFPSSARFDIRRWEIDLGWIQLRVLERLGLARIRRVAPRPVLDTQESNIDLDTLRAVIVNRMHVLRDYGRQVTLPVLRRELAGATDRGWHRMLRSARKLLVRQPALLDESARQRLSQTLAKSHPLQTVHEFRERLSEIWQTANVSNERLLQQLREWCAQAEASGIKALQEFSASLRRYSLQAC